MTRHPAAARHGEPWLVALIAGIALAVLTAAIAWASTHPDPTPAPAPRPQPAPTTPWET